MFTNGLGSVPVIFLQSVAMGNYHSLPLYNSGII